MDYIIAESKNNDKMTARDFFKAIASNESISSIYRDYAKAQIGKLDDKNKSRIGKVSKADKAKKAENEALKEKILALLTEKGATMVAADIGRHCDNITTQKASAMLRQLVVAGKVNSREVSVKGKGKMKGYSIAK